MVLCFASLSEICIEVGLLLLSYLAFAYVDPYNSKRSFYFLAHRRLPLGAVHFLKRTDEAALIIQQKYRNRLFREKATFLAHSTFADVVEAAVVASKYHQETTIDENHQNDEENIRQTPIKTDVDNEEIVEPDISIFYTNVFVALVWTVQTGFKIFRALHRVFDRGGGPHSDLAAAAADPATVTTNTTGGGWSGGGGIATHSGGAAAALPPPP